MDFIHKFLSFYFSKVNKASFPLYYFLKSLSSDWKPYIHTTKMHLSISFSFFRNLFSKLYSADSWIVLFFDKIIFHFFFFFEMSSLEWDWHNFYGWKDAKILWEKRLFRLFFLCQYNKILKFTFIYLKIKYFQNHFICYLPLGICQNVFKGIQLRGLYNCDDQDKKN